MSEDLSWGHSTVETSCPLDCPDACSLAVSVDAGKGHEDRRQPPARHHQRLHLRQGPRLRRAPLRQRPAAVPADPHRPQGQGPVPPGVVERGARRHRQPHRRGPHAQRRRSDPPLLLRRVERPADAGSRRRALLPAPRRVAPGAHGVRRADRRRRARPLRQDVRRRLRGLPRRAADRAVGRQSVGIRHPSGPLRARGAAQGRDADRRRSAADRAREAGRPAHRAAAGHRPAGRARPAPLPVRERARRRDVPARSRDRRRRAARRRRAVDDCPRRRRRRPRAGDARAVRPPLRHGVAGADPLWLGPRAQPQRRPRGDGRARAPGGGRQVRRARRRLLDEQLGRVAAEQPRLDWRRRAGDARRQHERARRGAADAAGSEDRGAVRLQRQPGRDHPGSERGDPRPRARGSVHRRVRAGPHRHRAVRGRGAAGDHLPRALRPESQLRRPRDAAGQAGHRAGRRVPAERRRLQRARGPSRPVRGTDRGRDRGAVPRRAAAARRHRRGRPRRRRGPAARRQPPDPVRRRAPAHRRPARSTCSPPTCRRWRPAASTATRRIPPPAITRWR